ncbi:PAS domain S-box-containing protein [Natronoarchaeum philippinense]|uniref:PAS domain S-box-containing protein n=1 Tax=Natronoarchaeum philippinense TaxID=558529 RepID=A0A285N457_NATPI|nr:histidine kinase N-terminal 7TM domain-containing protein [Natronoarchaeum philippinense]SNZ04254.1 PAS domain S-box-containing protein [Natronoarchaeum philippinense]
MVLTNVYTLTLLPVAGICLLVAGYAWGKRPSPGAVPFAVFNVGAAVWAFGSAMAAASSTGAGSLGWIYVQYVGIATLPTAWLAFGLDYTGRERWLTRRSIAALSIEPLVLLALTWTSHRHGLIYRSISPITVDGVTTVELTPAAGFWLHTAYSYALVVIGTAMLVHLMVTVPRRYRSRTVAVLASILAPVALNLGFLAGAIELPIDPTPYAYAVSGTVGTWALIEKDLFDVPPIAPTVAHGIVFEQVADGVLIVDAGGRIVDYNDAARALLADGVEPQGAHIDELLPSLADVLAELDGPSDAVEEVSLTADGRERYFEITSRPIEHGRHRRLGRLITLHDITDRQLREQRLDVLHRVLRHNVRQETNKILGHADFLQQPTRDDDTTEHADAIETAARDLVDWSNQARSIERTLAPADSTDANVDAERAVEAVLDDLLARHPEVEVATSFDADATVRAHVSLQEALYEIVENAIEHNDAATPRIEITGERSGQWFELTVSDNGTGLPEPELAVLDRGRETPLEHGSGLGLWLVSWTVRASRGTLDIEADDGTTITMRLPSADAEDDDVGTDCLLGLDETDSEAAGVSPPSDGSPST